MRTPIDIAKALCFCDDPYPSERELMALASAFLNERPHGRHLEEVLNRSLNRAEFAKAAVQGILSDASNSVRYWTPEFVNELAVISVRCADALIAALQARDLDDGFTNKG